MYQNLANQNSIINQFNGYMAQNPDFIPFRNNQLINNNVHVLNHLTDYLQQHRILQQNIPVLQQQMNQTNVSTILPIASTDNKSKNINIIQEILKPQKIMKEQNKDVTSNFQVRKQIQEEAEKGNIGIKITNAPYKSIIKDKIITKKVEDVTKEDLIVHKADKAVDANLEKFMHDLDTKEKEKRQINDELKIEFSINNYDKHKKKFEYKETFVRNLAFEQNTFDESKQDFIEFYRQKQKEAEEGQKLCDQILRNMVDEGIISKDELPTEQLIDNNKDIDLGIIIDNIELSNKQVTNKKSISKQNELTVTKTTEKTDKPSLKAIMSRKSKRQ